MEAFFVGEGIISSLNVIWSGKLVVLTFTLNIRVMQPATHS